MSIFTKKTPPLPPLAEGGISVASADTRAANDTLKIFEKPNDYNTITLSPDAIRSATSNNEKYKPRLHLYEKVLKDEHFLSKKNDLESIFNKVEWTIEPSGVDKIDDFVREYLWKVLSNNVFKHIHEALFAGFSVNEIIWQDNVPVAIEPLPQKAFNFKEGVLFIYDEENDKYFEIPPFKTIQTFAPQWINKLPVGLAEILAPAVALKHSVLYKNWAHFVEFAAMPMMWGFARTAEQQTALATALKQLGKSSVAVAPTDTDIKFVQAPNLSVDVFKEIILMCKDAISISIVGQTLTTQTSGTGSYALGEVHSSVRDDFLENSLDLVCDAINQQLVKPMVEFNFGTPIVKGGTAKVDRLYPEFRLINPVSTAKKIALYKGLYEIGVRLTPKRIQEDFGLGEDDFTIKEETKPLPLSDRYPFV